MITYLMFICMLDVTWEQLEKPNLNKLDPLVKDQIERLEKRLSNEMETDPERALEQWRHLGNVYHAYEFYPQAITCYRNVLMITKGSFQDLYWLGSVYYAINQRDEAMKTWIAASQLQPDYVATWIKLGNIHLDKSEWDQAREMFEQARSIDEGEASSYFGLGRVAMALGYHEIAIDQFKRTLAIVPKADRIHYLIARAYRHLKQNEKAKEHLAKAGKIGVKPTDRLSDLISDLVQGERLFLVEGKRAYQFGQYNDAVKAFNQVLIFNPESVPALINLASSMIAIGTNERAVEFLEKAKKIEPANVTALFNLGSLLLAQNEPARAELNFKEVVALDPTDSQAYYLMGESIRKQGDVERSLMSYASAIQLKPDFEDAILIRETLLIQLTRFDQVAENLAQANLDYPTLGRLTHLYARFLAACPDQRFRNGPKAVDLASRVVEARSTTEHLETLAMAYAENGQCGLAYETQLKAIESAKMEAKTRSLSQMQAELKHYDRNPCRPN